MPQSINGGAGRYDDVCTCYHPWEDHELDEFEDEDFDDDPCPMCGGRSPDLGPPTWIEEEEDEG